MSILLGHRHPTVVSAALFQLCAFPVLASDTINQRLPGIHYMNVLHLLNPSVWFSLCPLPHPSLCLHGCRRSLGKRAKRRPRGSWRRRRGSRLALEMRWPQLQPQISLTHVLGTNVCWGKTQGSACRNHHFCH